MKITVLLLTVLIAASAFAQDGLMLKYNEEAFSLRQKYAYGQAEDETEAPAATPTFDPNKKSPGKALLLSAIMPGAGEMYAGSTLKAILFFGMEVAAWTGVAIYQADGNDKEEQFQAYADAHWSQARYWTWLETIPDWANPNVAEQYYPELDFGGFNGMFYPHEEYNDFEDENGFTHNLPETKTQQYYEMIGKYMTQFGPGWDDAWVNGVPPDAVEINSTYVWNDTQNWPNGKTNNSDYYMNMRYDSNKALDKAALFFQLVMLNHVVSALDAGFTVRAKNKKIDTAFNVVPEERFNETVPMGQVTINW